MAFGGGGEGDGSERACGTVGDSVERKKRARLQAELGGGLA